MTAGSPSASMSRATSAGKVHDAPAQEKQRAPLFLFFLCLFLGIFVFLQANADRSGPTTIETAAVKPAKIPALPAAQAFQMPPIEDFGETLDRPLFSKIRRPPAPEPDAPGEKPEKKQTVKVRLAGVVISPKERVALVQYPRTRENTRVKEGQEIEGWVLESILADRIILRFGELREEVKIEGEVRRAPVKRKKKARPKRRRPRSRTRDANPADER